jgi:CRP/FNR family cyclic AMP-dependent transcriptional regulator
MSRFRTDERLELLRGVRLFSNCTRDELRRIESLTSVLELPRGTVLAEQGTIGHEFFVIAEGSASASRSGKRLARLDPGSFFGELALLDGGERTATVTADTEISLIVLSRSEFLSLQSSAPSVAYKILVELGSRLRRIYEHFLDDRDPPLASFEPSKDDREMAVADGSLAVSL